MEIDIQDEINRDGFIFYSVLYSSVTLLFAMAVLSKFLTNEFRFGFRSFLSLITLFLGEPLCQFMVKGPSGLLLFSFGCLLVYYILPASQLPIDDKSVLITGMDRIVQISRKISLPFASLSLHFLIFELSNSINSIHHSN